LPGEQPVIEFAYASIVSIRDIEEREKFTLDNLWVKRPGTGIPAAELGLTLGRRARRSLKSDVTLTPEDIVK
jgi:N-acetylneuraminate synthase